MKLIKNNQEAYMGWHDGHPIWDRGIVNPLTIPFYVESRGEVMDVSIGKIRNDAPTIAVEYSLDGTTWQSLGSTSTTALTINVPAGGKVWLRAKTNTWAVLGVAIDNFNYIASSSPCNVGGNIMSLLYGDTFTGQCEFPDTTVTHIFGGLFRNGSWCVDASKLLLPATTLASNCYSYMFCGGVHLTAAPKLPATTLAGLCYYGMFQNCTGLTVAPELPATTLDGYCYQSMFSGCTRLEYIKCLAKDMSAPNCLAGWVSGVASIGTFVKKTGTSWPTGASGIPSGWTVVEV